MIVHCCWVLSNERKMFITVSATNGALSKCWLGPYEEEAYGQDPWSRSDVSTFSAPLCVEINNTDPPPHVGHTSFLFPSWRDHCMPHWENGYWLCKISLSPSLGHQVAGSSFVVTAPASCRMEIEGCPTQQCNKHLGWSLIQGAGTFTDLSGHLFCHFSIRVLGNHKFSHGGYNTVSWNTCEMRWSVWFGM